MRKISTIDQDGKARWTHSLPADYIFREGLAFGSHFLVPVATARGVEELRCYRSDTGTIAKVYRFGRTRSSISEEELVGAMSLDNY